MASARPQSDWGHAPRGGSPFARRVRALVVTVLLVGGCATQGPASDNTMTEEEPANPDALVEPPECNLGMRIPDAQAVRTACTEIESAASSTIDIPTVVARPGPPRLTVTDDGRLRYEVARIENGLWENLAVLYRKTFQYYGWTELPSGDPMVLRFRGRRPGHHWDYEAVVRLSQDPSVRTAPQSPTRLDSTLEMLEPVVPPEMRATKID